MYRVPGTGRIKLEFRVITVVVWLPRVFILYSVQVQPNVLPQALQASIDGKEFMISADGFLTSSWPAGTPTTEKDNKAKKIRR